VTSHSNVAVLLFKTAFCVVPPYWGYCNSRVQSIQTQGFRVKRSDTTGITQWIYTPRPLIRNSSVYANGSFYTSRRCITKLVYNKDSHNFSSAFLPYFCVKKCLLAPELKSTFYSTVHTANITKFLRLSFQQTFFCIF